MRDFLAGMGFALCCVAGLFFLRFWRKTRDRFFAFFAAAFWLMAFHRLVLMGLSQDNEYVGETYAVRLLSYVLILVAIVDKNRGPRGRKGPGPPRSGA